MGTLGAIQTPLKNHTNGDVLLLLTGFPAWDKFISISIFFIGG
jgi:hypothetical protein